MNKNHPINKPNFEMYKLTKILMQGPAVIKPFEAIVSLKVGQ